MPKRRKTADNTGPAPGYPDDFLAALRLLGMAMEEVAAAGQQRPVLVGGAALELWTAGQYVSRDLDLVAVDPAPIEAALIARGFRREDRRGHLLRGLHHPELGIGVECVMPTAIKNGRWHESFFGAPPPTHPARDTNRRNRWKSQRFRRLVSVVPCSTDAPIVGSCA